MGRREGEAPPIARLIEDAEMHERPVRNEARTGRSVPDVSSLGYFIRASGMEA